MGEGRSRCIYLGFIFLESHRQTLSLVVFIMPPPPHTLTQPHFVPIRENIINVFVLKAFCFKTKGYTNSYGTEIIKIMQMLKVCRPGRL